jgi:pantoate--beta-alanine ligase
MKIIRGIKQMQVLSGQGKRKGLSIGLVPTMGALHDGHLSLVRRCREENDISVVSIFVNPIQFGPNEDFKRYPRPARKDAMLCRKEGVNYIFYPSAQAMYPPDFKTSVSVRELGKGLCGASRPGHFDGVTTVVAKLFNIVKPDNAYFGQKDAQQAVIIKRMAKDLDFGINIKVMPIVREKDGLALSSRNIYLDRAQRAEALCLSAALSLAKDLIKSGQRDTLAVIRGMSALVSSAKNADIEYIKIVDPNNLKEIDRVNGECLICLAVRIGNTRLIDNIVIKNPA